jgi:hypothetical protein
MTTTTPGGAANTQRPQRDDSDLAPTPAARPVPTPRDVLGVPFLPPGLVADGSNRFRWGLGRLHGRLGAPPIRILEGVFGMLDHRVLVALCEAGVPDALTGRTTPEELAVRLGADPVRLERLLRYGASRGWLRVDRRGRVRPTKVTTFLRADHPSGWRAWVDFAGGAEVVAAVANLGTRPDAGDGFAAVNGKPFFEWMADHPDRWATFDRAMAAGGRMHALTLDKALSWKGSRRVCDVGGGTGDLLAALLDLNPGLHGAVFDLPAVVARSVRHERLTAIAGDAFVEVPGGFDTYLLVNVLHDWNDHDAGRILERVAQAASADARIVVVDSAPSVVPRPDMGIAADVLMAALTDGGQERDAAAFAALARPYGLTLRRTTRLASGDLAHELRRT